MTVRSQAGRLLRKDWTKDPNGLAREMAAMLRSPDVTQQLEGVAATATSGQATLGADFPLTNAMQNTGLSVRLPAAGTYLLLCTVGSYIPSVSGTTGVSARLWDATKGAAITATTPVNATEANAATRTAADTIFAVYKVAAPTTVNLQAERAFGSLAACTVTAANGTALAYVRLA
jgi:hypothetical protein